MTLRSVPRARDRRCWSRASPQLRAGGRQAAPPTQKPRRRRRRSRPRRHGAERRVRSAASKPATEARQAERWEEAIALYAKAVKLKPDVRRGLLVSGHGVLLARRLRRSAAKRSARWCGSRRRTAPRSRSSACASSALKDYDRSLQHLLQSRILGVGDTPDLGSVARYHAAILMTRMEQYEQALETLGEFAGEGDDNPRVIEAMGIATLRMPLLPIESAARSPRDDADGRPRQLHDGDAQHRRRGEGVRGARRPLSGDAERALRLRRVPAAGSSRTRRSRSSSASSSSSRTIRGR